MVEGIAFAGAGPMAIKLAMCTFGSLYWSRPGRGGRLRLRSGRVSRRPRGDSSSSSPLDERNEFQLPLRRRPFDAERSQLLPDVKELPRDLGREDARESERDSARESVRDWIRVEAVLGRGLT